MRKKTHKEFMESFELVKSKFENLRNLEVVGEYTTSRNQISVRCEIHNHTYTVRASALLEGSGCPECVRLNPKSTDTFIDELRIVSPTLTVVGEYINNKTKIDIHCNVCVHDNQSYPYDLLSGVGCPNCFKLSRYKTTGTFKNEVSQINPSVELVSEYLNNKTIVELRCVDCGHIWSALPNNIRNGKLNCPNCKDITKSYSEFINDFLIANPHDASEYEFYEDTYSGYKNPVLVKHSCGYVYTANESRKMIIGGFRCPICKRNMSTGASLSLKTLEQLGTVDIQLEKTFDDLVDILPLKYDFYVHLNEKELLVEYNGEQHYKPNSNFHVTEDDWLKRQEHDKTKKEYAISNSKYYLEIPSTVPFSEIGNFIKHYVNKLESTRVLNLVPQPIIDFLTRRLMHGLPEIPYGEWCLLSGDMRYNGNNSPSDAAIVQIMDLDRKIYEVEMMDYISYMTRS